MKHKLSIFILVLFTACSNNKNEKKAAIEGKYVASFETEYNKGMDTIEITPINNEAGTFHYVRRIGYRTKSNGVFGQMENKTQTSTCVFNQQTAQINEQRHGRIYSLSTDGNQLVFGSSTYKRIQ